jgi:hypothetical protein
MGGLCSTHGREKKRIELPFEDLKERDCLEDRSIDVEIKLKWILKKMNERLWTVDCGLHSPDSELEHVTVF